jgi:hypothetical protein
MNPNLISRMEALLKECYGGRMITLFWMNKAFRIGISWNIIGLNFEFLFSC